jgi:hypothetical protein
MLCPVSHADGAVRSVQAGAGRPFRFSLVLGDGKGALFCWLGGKWAVLFGVFTVAVFAGVGGLTGALLPDPPVAREVFVCAAAGVGAAAVALHLRPRTVLFLRRGESWFWKERWSLLHPRWSPITDDRPLRLEREILSSVEGWTLYADTVRIFSYLGDPSIGRSVTAAFQQAGVPLRTVMKREQSS